MSLHRTLARLGVLAVATTAALTGLAGAAAAHVTVSSVDATPGGYGTLTFRIPDESPTASTVSVRIQLPKDTPLASVRIRPVPGWTITPTTAAIDPPLTDDDGNTISSAVSVLDVTADPGAGIAPGQFQEFAISAGPLPASGQLVFNVVQTYSDGSEVAWIEPTVAGQPEPEHPAPVLSLPAGSAGAAATAGATGPAAVAGTTGGGGTSALSVSALVVALVALVAGITGTALGWAARRRTVSS